MVREAEKMRRRSQRQVALGTERMARAQVRRAARLYRRDVLGPVAERIAALPAGDEADDEQMDRANLERMRAVLGPDLLERMDTAGLAESIAAAGLQAELIGTVAAAAEVGSEK